MRYNDLDQYVEYLRSFPRFSPREYLKLDRIRQMLKLMGHPERKLKGIQVAGTNGKGSTVALTATALKEAGYKTGAFYSPHLVSYTERFRINGRPISQQRMAELITSLKPVVIETKKKIGDQPTWFEVLTAAAVRYFVDERVDWAVFEVGLGGRFDATTALGLKYKIITDISLDHTHILGKSITAIAKEKAGIVQKRNVVITSNNGAALKQIKLQCRKTNSKLLVPPKISHKKLKIDKTEFLIHERNKKIKVQTALVGATQAINAGLVYRMLYEVLGLPSNDILNAFKKTSLEGRFQVIEKTPLIVIDGAHNVTALRKLVKTIQQLGYQRSNTIIIFSAKLRKQYPAMVRLLKKNSKLLVFPKLEIANMVPPATLTKYAASAITARNIKQAIKLAKTKSGKRDIILITGSFYFIGEVIRLWHGNSSVKIDQIDDNQAEQKL